MLITKVVSRSATVFAPQEVGKRNQRRNTKRLPQTKKRAHLLRSNINMMIKLGELKHMNTTEEGGAIITRT